MTYATRDTYGIYKENDHKGSGPELMGANTLIGDHVHNMQDEHLGDIKEFMLDMADQSWSENIRAYYGTPVN